MTLWEVTWTGTFALLADDLVASCTFAGSARSLVRTCTGNQLAGLDATLRGGTPVAVDDLLPRLRLAWGLPDGAPLPALHIRSPRELRIAMAVWHPPVPGPADRIPGIRGFPTLAGPPLRSRQLTAAARRLGRTRAWCAGSGSCCAS